MSRCPRPDKLAHPTRELAYAHLASMRKRVDVPPTLGVYRCGDHWHIGKDQLAIIANPKPRKRGSHIGNSKRRKRVKGWAS